MPSLICATWWGRFHLCVPVLISRGIISRISAIITVSPSLRRSLWHDCTFYRQRAKSHTRTRSQIHRTLLPIIWIGKLLSGGKGIWLLPEQLRLMEDYLSWSLESLIYFSTGDWNLFSFRNVISRLPSENDVINILGWVGLSWVAQVIGNCFSFRNLMAQSPKENDDTFILWIGLGFV